MTRSCISVNIIAEYLGGFDQIYYLADALGISVITLRDSSIPFRTRHALPTCRRVPFILCSAFLIALRSPFGQNTFTAIPPPAALSEKEVSTYLLFLNGLKKYYTVGG